MTYRCHHDTRYKGPREVDVALDKNPLKRFRKTNCPFQITFKVLKDNVNTFSCNVLIEHCHNHAVSSLEHLIFWRFDIIIPFTFWDICVLEICEMLSDIKNYYWFILLLAFGEFSDHDHTVLINEYQRNYDVITSKYVRKLNKSHW